MPLSPVVHVNGSALAEHWLAALLDVRVEREFQIPSRCTLRFTDPGYVLTAAAEVHLGTTITVSVEEEGGPASELVHTEVTSIAVDQREGEQPELVVVAHDKSHRMGRGTQIKSYTSMTYSDIVARIVQSHGMTPVVDATSETFDYVLQTDSDQGFVTELARRTGYDWWVDGSRFHFVRPKSSATVRLELGQELRSFSVRASGHHPDKVKVDGWDRDQQLLVVGPSAASNPQIHSKSEFASIIDSASGAYAESTLFTAGLAAASVGEADQLAQALFDRGVASALTVRGVTDGDARIVPGVTVDVSSAGPLSGTYPITKVEHVHRPRTGFVTRFQSGDRRPTSLVDSLGRGSRPLLAEQKSGVYAAEVTNINDPENRGRIKVRFPGVSDAEESAWARLVAVGGGTERGNVFIPEVKDQVLVAFETGDPRQPVVIGGLHDAKAKIPQTEIVGGKVQVRGMTSRLGHVVMLYDGEDPSQQAIGLVLAGKEHMIRLGKDKLDIEVPEGVPINVKAGATSIAISDEGDMKLQAAGKITIQSEEKISLLAPKVEITGDNGFDVMAEDVSVSGNSVSVSGGDSVSIKAAMVAIN